MFTLADSPTTCGANQYQCGDGMCIHKSWRCDKDRDCSEGEDEKDCRKFLLWTHSIDCTSQASDSITLLLTFTGLVWVSLNAI